MMTGAPFESLDILMKNCSHWLSFIILRHQDQQQKAQFRIFEVLFEKITNLKSHQIFNETYIVRVYINVPDWNTWQTSHVKSVITEMMHVRF